MLLCNQAESSEETIREKSLIKGQGVTINVSKVRTFWETPKIWKNLPHNFDKSADLLSKRQNHEEDFADFCGLVRKIELYKGMHDWNTQIVSIKFNRV